MDKDDKNINDTQGSMNESQEIQGPEKVETWFGSRVGFKAMQIAVRFSVKKKDY